MRTMKGLTIERIEQVTGGVLHMSVLTKAGIFANFERETLWKGSPRARWGFGAMLQREVSDIVTDSRKAGLGSLFGASRANGWMDTGSSRRSLTRGRSVCSPSVI